MSVLQDKYSCLSSLTVNTFVNVSLDLDNLAAAKYKNT